MFFFPSTVSTILSNQSGVYDIYLFGVAEGSASYRIESDTLSFTDSPTKQATSKGLVEFSNGRPIFGRFELAGKNPSTSEIQFGSSIKKRVGDRFEPISGPPSMVPFSPQQPYLAKLLLDQYGSKPNGFRDFKTLDFAKGTPRPVSVSLDKVEPRTIAGRTQFVKVWRLEMAPNPESVIWTDLSNRPLEWWIPSLNYETVLRGFEALRPSAPYEGKVSPVAYKVIAELNVWTPIRHGIRLKADIYRPDAPGRFPVILQRSCYDRQEFGQADGEYYASRGYVYVSQNVRGRGGSEGPFEPEVNEANDGHDAVEWCASQSWSNGKIGMLGASYNGYCGWMAAKTRPAGLKTIISVVPMPGPPNGEPWAGGAHYVNSDLSWFGLLRDPLKVQPFNDDLTAATNKLPMSDSDLVAFGHHVPEYLRRLKPDRFDDYVRQMSYRFEMKAIDMPVLYLDGWYDTVAVGTRLNYDQMVANGRKNQKLVWGPWDHFTNRESRVGDCDAGPQGYIDMHTLMLRWFDRWLKGRANGIDKEPSVSEYMLGANRWLTSNRWPPVDMKSIRLYLRSSGRLERTAPLKEAPSQYVYDPSTWVADSKLQSNLFGNLGADSAFLFGRRDVLSYETGLLKKPLRIDGPISGRLYASTSAKDTDWVMGLLDIRPDGKAIPLGVGFMRARYRDSFVKPKLLKPGQLVAYDIDMWETGIEIPTGHRIRVAVLSTLFPDMDRNLNTGEPIFNATRMVAAHQTVYHDKDRPSYVQLDVG